MITWDQCAELLAFAAVYDQRKADELDVKAWLAVAQSQRWTPTAVQRVIAEHYSAGAGRQRIDPATITDRLRTIRGRAAESFEAPVIPAQLSNHEYPAWLRAQLADHVEHLVQQWATTGEEPSRTQPVAAAPIQTLHQLVAHAPLHLRRELTDGTNRIQARRVRLDPERRAAAQAELEAARRRTEQAGA